jgi:hypothetical protein
MAATSRGAARDRHGRGIRRPISSKLFAHGQTRFQSFSSIVANTCEFLIDEWPQELTGMTWRIEDSPALAKDAREVQRWSVRENAKVITIYRLPVERLGSPKRNPIEERMRIEQSVFEAVAALLGKEPWQLIGGRD